MLQVSESQAQRQCVAVQAGPRAALEVVEAEFLLELRVSLLAHPARLDRSDERPPGVPCRQVGQVVLPLTGLLPVSRTPGLGVMVKLEVLHSSSQVRT